MSAFTQLATQTLTLLSRDFTATCVLLEFNQFEAWNSPVSYLGVRIAQLIAFAAKIQC